MDKLIACFLRVLAIVGSVVPIPIFTTVFMWHGMDGRTGVAWWLYLWAFVMTTMASVALAGLVAWNIWPRWYKTAPKRKPPKPCEIQPHVIEPEVMREMTPQEMANLALIEQNRHLASIL